MDVDHEVAVGDGVERVRRDRLEAQFARDELAVDRVADAGEGARAERQHVDAPPRLPQPLRVAREHLLVGEQVVGEQHGLCALQVRVAGHHRLRLALGEVDQRASQCPQARGGRVAGGAHEHPQVGRHLVVTRARGVQPPRRFADAFGERGLDVEMDVLAILAELEAPASISASMARRPSTIASRSAASMMPCLASMRACAIEPAMSSR